MKSILYIGIDVDDKNFHVGGICLETGEVSEYKTKPTLGALLKKLNKLRKEYKLKVCYESSYIGYNLCRDLNKEKINCEIVATSLIPAKPGNHIKTDRLDALKLAKYYSKDLLTPIYIPDETDESVRDLIRTRSFLVLERKKLKLHILSTCRRYRINYKEDNKSFNYWTKTHLNWLSSQINKMKGTAKKIFEILIYELDKINEGIEICEKEIYKISENKRYKKKKDTLNCFRGLDTLSSMTLIVESGDIKRFSHPNKIVSYAGLDIREYSSGGKERKYGITKMGNRRIRTTVIEACQTLSFKPKISNRLRASRKGQDIKVIEIADRCMQRLSKKYIKMLNSGKNYNKIKVACARELLCFVWEALTFVS